jgi:hypothetical protein
MAPELADRVAKLLRLACSTGPDGEKLAAIGRLSAIVIAHNVDWDRALANGNSATLTEEAASKIYWEGHARGVAETEQRLQSQRDWTPAAGTSSEIGDDAERLEAILQAATESRDAGLLTDWEINFSNDMRDRFETYGNRMYVSEKQWAILDRLETKMHRAGVLSIGSLAMGAT